MIYLLFFLSGLSGLIYQVVWVRMFGNVFGNTIYSASIEAIIAGEPGTKYPLAAHNALAFQVFDTETSRVDQRGGVVAPDLPWTFTSQNQPERDVPASVR